MKQTVRVELTDDNKTGNGHLLYCCERWQPVPIDALNDGDYWSCVECEKPLMIRIDDDLYEVGSNITV